MGIPEESEPARIGIGRRSCDTEEATMTVAITRSDLSAADLRAKAARTEDAKAARRLLAIALVLEGWSRQDAAVACAMDRQTLRDWVHRYNAAGTGGLHDQPRRNGPPPRLSPEQQAKVVEWVEQGPELERDGVVRWRCIDLRRRIKQAFAVDLHESAVGKMLRRLDFARLQPRPCHPKKDLAAQEAFIDPAWVKLKRLVASPVGRDGACGHAQAAGRSARGAPAAGHRPAAGGYDLRRGRGRRWA
jgi:transposase